MHTHPLRGGLFDAEDFDSFGQVELVVFKVCAEEGGLCARVGERNANVADHRGLVLLHAQLSGALLEYDLKPSIWVKKIYENVHKRSGGQMLVSITR